MGNDQEFSRFLNRISSCANASGVWWKPPNLYSHTRARVLIGSVRRGVSCLGCSCVRPAVQFNYFIPLSRFFWVGWNDWAGVAGLVWLSSRGVAGLARMGWRGWAGAAGLGWRGQGGGCCVTQEANRGSCARCDQEPKGGRRGARHGIAKRL